MIIPSPHDKYSQKERTICMKKKEYQSNTLSDSQVLLMLLYCFGLLVVCYHIRLWLYG